MKYRTLTLAAALAVLLGAAGPALADRDHGDRHRQFHGKLSRFHGDRHGDDHGRFHGRLERFHDNWHRDGHRGGHRGNDFWRGHYGHRGNDFWRGHYGHRGNDFWRGHYRDNDFYGYRRFDPYPYRYSTYDRHHKHDRNCQHNDYQPSFWGQWY